MHKKKIFISGATGRIGKPLTKALREKGYVVLESSRSLGLDILDKARIRSALRKFRPDVIIHLAGDHIDPASTAVRGTQNLLDIAREVGVKQFIFSSSAMVYEENNEAYHDDTKPLPKLTSYSPRAKQRAEELVAKFKKPLIFRISSVYDPNNPPLVKKILGIKVLFEVHGYRISLLHINDAVSAFVFGIEKGLTGTYNLASFYPTHREVGLAHGAIVIPVKYLVVGNQIPFVFKVNDRRDYIVMIDKIKAKGWKPSFALNR
jgi:nucleoside-diphosphate-sugar epimerase